MTEWNWTEDMMPGPDHAKALQLKQCQAREAYYDSLRGGYHLDRETLHAQPHVAAAREAYEATVTELKTLLGPQAHCAEVDTDKWSLFSDMYKEDAGFRPRGDFTVGQVDWWLDHWQKHGFQDDGMDSYPS